jgi:tetratricopeptide (TPR) repeat protein
MRAMRALDLEAAIDRFAFEPPESPCYVLARCNLALTLRRLGRWQEAEAVARSALTLIAERGCPHPPSVVQVARTLAEAVSAQGRHVESFKLFADAQARSEELAATHPEQRVSLEIEMAHAFNSWGSAHIHVRQYELSLELFDTALDVYARYPDQHPKGRAHVLTNKSLALRELGRVDDARQALATALPIAQKEGTDEQSIRILVALMQLSDGMEAQKYFEEIIASADREIGRGSYATAYVRLCAIAQRAAELSQFEQGLDAIERLRKLEGLLDRREINPARLRMTWATLLEQSGATQHEVCRVLIQGAHLWFSRIADNLVHDDFSALTREMHEHFRYLSTTLLALGKLSEALVGFEAGRALAHSVEVDPSFLGRVVAANPFSAAGDSVELSWLRSAQAILSEDDVLLSIPVLPPEIVAFVITRNDVAVVREPMPESLDERDELFKAIRAIPYELQQNVGPRAVPDICHSLAKQLAARIGARVVRAIMPYSHLHAVPWRTLLRWHRVAWPQLLCRIEFGLMLHGASATRTSIDNWCALGVGTAGDLDLADEARDFAKTVDATVRIPCTGDDVTKALTANGAVFVSCHGKAVAVPGHIGRDLAFEFADGTRNASTILPQRVSASVVILSACESGVYEMSWGDFPYGLGPALVRAGASTCIGARFLLRASFAAAFFREVALQLAGGHDVDAAIAFASSACHASGADLWRDLACIEILG